MKNASILVALAVALPTSLQAQQPRGGGFNVPKAGTTLPDVSAFNSDGTPFSTRDLKGDYSVLVFGCLT